MVNIKDILKKLWNGKCTVYVQCEMLNPTNKQTEFGEGELFSNLCCKLSFERVPVNDKFNNAYAINQSVKLFLDNQYKIPSGSKIVVTQNGITETYINSGKPAFYSSHQEIPLELFKGWA